MGPSAEFVNALQVSIRDGIGNTLGVPVMETLLTLLKHPFQLYAEKPVELHRELHGIFGSPAETLERGNWRRAAVFAWYDLGEPPRAGSPSPHLWRAAPTATRRAI